MDQLRIGLIGAGPWGRGVHAPGIAGHPRATLAGVWTRRPEPAREIVAEHGGVAFDSVEALLDAVDAVAFAVPPQVQGELALRAAAAGRHLVLDKPLADSLPAAEEVAAAISAAAVCSTTMLTMRFDPAVRAWLAGLPGGSAGPDTVGSARWLSGALLGGPYAASAWRAERGALLDIGPHMIDLLDAALGEVTGIDWAHLDEPDLWRIGLLHDGGARSTVTMSLQLPVEPTEVEVTAFGSIGRHVLATRPMDPVACYGVLLDEFTAAVRDGRTDLPQNADRALHLQRLLDAVQHTISA
ncbi:MAG: Gfo/Idh/MocA family oxidoreductase [Pseudonocardia sp.]|nr:Gfo/Idh/MocA family oxidoreductase [Pseudonocardia sp.]